MTDQSVGVENERSFCAFLLWKLEGETRKGHRSRLTAKVALIRKSLESLELAAFLIEKDDRVRELIDLRMDLEVDFIKKSAEAVSCSSLGSERASSHEALFIQRELDRTTRSLRVIESIDHTSYLDIRPEENSFPIKEYDAYCIDNIGLEEQFDLEVAYIVESDEIGLVEIDGLLNVCGKHGDFFESSSRRFKIVEADE